MKLATQECAVVRRDTAAKCWLLMHMGDLVLLPYTDDAPAAVAAIHAALSLPRAMIGIDADSIGPETREAYGETVWLNEEWHKRVRSAY